jgi:nicotinamide-nucleotide amidase
LIVRGKDRREVDAVISKASTLAGIHAFTSSPDESLEHVVGRLLDKTNRTLATAESCTGGLLASLITSVPGSSSWFLQGWVTYANQAKISALDVEKDLLETAGAVSESMARAMAESARRQSGADYALALTGIAGPGGGTEEKPVGLVYTGFAGPSFIEVKKRFFTGDRNLIRLMAARTALLMLRQSILEEAR